MYTKDPAKVAIARLRADGGLRLVAVAYGWWGDDEDQAAAYLLECERFREAARRRV